MGDRGNIVIDQGSGKIYLYTHWSGYNIGETLQTALRKRWRWDDPSYLTRIIYDTLVGKDFGGETGYGISVREEDNSHPLLIVNCREQTVTRNSFTWTFEEFINLPKIDF